MTRIKSLLRDHVNKKIYMSQYDLLFLRDNSHFYKVYGSFAQSSKLRGNSAVTIQMPVGSIETASRELRRRAHPMPVTGESTQNLNE
jgi:hypothetical protein